MLAVEFRDVVGRIDILVVGNAVAAEAGVAEHLAVFGITGRLYGADAEQRQRKAKTADPGMNHRRHTFRLRGQAK
jgi:hypothetical protein